MTRVLRNRDFLGAIALIAFALGFLRFGSGLNRGEAASMGPGYVPMAVSAILLLLGLYFAAMALVRQGEAIDWPSWRPTVIIVACPILFGLLLPHAGLFLTVAATATVSRLAGRQRWGMAALVTPVVLAAFCAVVFVHLLELPIAVWP